MSKLKEIFQNRDKIWEGLRNKMFKKEHIEIIYNERLEICKGCESYDVEGVGCSLKGSQPCCNIKNGGCGCSLSIKLRSLSTDCPKKKWLAIVQKQEESMIKAQIDKNEAENK
jgi:hypothetical protein